MPRPYMVKTAGLHASLSLFPKLEIGAHRIAQVYGGGMRRAFVVFFLHEADYLGMFFKRLFGGARPP